MECSWHRKHAHRSRGGTENVASPTEFYQLELGWVQGSGMQQGWGGEQEADGTYLLSHIQVESEGAYENTGNLSELSDSFTIRKVQFGYKEMM